MAVRVKRNRFHLRRDHVHGFREYIQKIKERPWKRVWSFGLQVLPYNLDICPAFKGGRHGTDHPRELARLRVIQR